MLEVLLIAIPKLFHVLLFVWDEYQVPTHNRRELAVVNQVQEVQYCKKCLHYQKQENVREARKTIEVEPAPAVALEYGVVKIVSVHSSSISQSVFFGKR